METIRKIGEMVRELNTVGELKIVNQMLRDRASQLNRAVAVQAQAAFQLGDRVEFNSRKRGGAIIRGIITGILPKNIKIKTDDGVVWTVFPTLLRKVEG